MNQKIDPDFMREIEIALITMTDYARNRGDANNAMENIRQKDIERSEMIIESISDWFDGFS